MRTYAELISMYFGFERPEDDAGRRNTVWDVVQELKGLFNTCLEVYETEIQLRNLVRLFGINLDADVYNVQADLDWAEEEDAWEFKQTILMASLLHVIDNVVDIGVLENELALELPALFDQMLIVVMG